MKKSIIVSILALMIALTAAGCGNKSTGSALVGGTGSTVSTSDTAADSPSSTPAGSEQEQLEHFAEDSDKKINTDKIEGTEAKTDKSGTRGDGKMTTCEVTVDRVKVADVNGSPVVFVQFDFKNTSSSELRFDGEVYAEAYQDGMELPPAIFSEDIEGFAPESIMQMVEPGKSIKVQKAYTASDSSTPLEIYIRDAYDDSTYLAQVFRIN